MPHKPPIFKYGAAVIGGLTLCLAFGFFVEAPWATALWPWSDGRLSYLFIASILAAIAVNLIWLGWIGDWGTAVGGALNLGLTDAGAGAYLFELYRSGGEPRLLWQAIGLSLFAATCVAILLWAWRVPVRDRRPLPRPVRVSYWMFAVLLAVVGGALLLQRPTIFPWPLRPATSVIFGWIFLGAAVSFIYASLRPTWNDARGQLAGFLAYDLVLIGPYLAHFAVVRPEHLTSLVIYTLVLVYSGALAIYYLFLDKATRGWSIQAAS